MKQILMIDESGGAACCVCCRRYGDGLHRCGYSALAVHGSVFRSENVCKSFINQSGPSIRPEGSAKVIRHVDVYAS